jgi:hypothetical protein
MFIFRNEPKENFRVVVGDLDNTMTDEKEQFLDVEEIIIHPQYESSK